MTETLREQPTPEQRVFGDAFSFQDGVADDTIVQSFFKQRFEEIRNGTTAWMPRILDADGGIAADLYVDNSKSATLHFEYETQKASVYVTSSGGEPGDTTLCDQVEFGEAVEQAEQFAQSKN